MHKRAAPPTVDHLRFSTLRWHIFLLLASFVIFSGACQQRPGTDEGSNAGDPTHNAPADFVISPPDRTEVPASTITLFGKVPPETKLILANTQAGDIQSDQSFLVDVPLSTGTNAITVVAIDSRENVIARAMIHVTSTATARPVGVRLSTQVAEVDSPVSIDVQTAFPVSQVMFDFDGNGSIDLVQADLSTSHRYGEGTFKPKAIVRTRSGTYFSTPPFDPTAVLFVGLNPKSSTTTLPSRLIDLELSAKGDVWLLAEDSITHLNASLVTLETVRLPSNIVPSGFALAPDETFVITEASPPRLIRTLHNGTINTDWAHGGSLSFPQSSESPLSATDVAVAENGELFLLDAMGSRLFKLSQQGLILRSVPVPSPGSRVEHLNGGLYVIESKKTLRVFDTDLRLSDSCSLPHEPISILGLALDGTTMVGITSEGSAVLLDSRCSLLRTVRISFLHPIAAALSTSVDGWTIFSAPATQELTRTAVSVIAEDATPMGVWSAFLTGLGHDDLGGITTFITGRAREQLLPVLEAMTGEERRTFVGSAGTLVPVEVRGSYAYYELSSGAGTVSFVFNPSTKRWEIDAF